MKLHVRLMNSISRCPPGLLGVVAGIIEDRNPSVIVLIGTCTRGTSVEDRGNSEPWSFDMVFLNEGWAHDDHDVLEVWRLHDAILLFGPTWVLWTLRTEIIKMDMEGIAPKLEDCPVGSDFEDVRVNPLYEKRKLVAQ